MKYANVSPGRFLLVLFGLGALIASLAFAYPSTWQANRISMLVGVVCAVLAGRKFGGLLSKGSIRQVGSVIGTRSTESTPAAPGYFWGGESLPFEEACKHFIAIGGTGSGKSITLNLLAQSVLLKMGQGDGVRRRAVIYDPKSDLGSFLAGVNPAVKMTIMNPMDRRFSPWDIAADVTTETDALEFASILIPKNERENSPYFNDTARSLIAGVVKRFNATIQPGERWTLRDLVLACETTAALRAVLNFEGTLYLQEHFHPDNARNYAGVKSTLDNAMSLYRPIAALAATARGKPLSLKRWLESEDSVLLLGNHESAREATDTLNRLIFRQLSKLIIDRPGTAKSEETWIFLDEVREAGALAGLRQLLLRGRSKGVALAMGFQDTEGMYAAYGVHEAAEIIGAAQNIKLLHLNPSAPATVELASRMFSSRRDYVSAKSVTVGQQISTTSNRHLDLVPNVLPVEFVELPMPSPRHGLGYFVFTNTKGFGRGRYSWEFLETHGPIGVVAPSFPDFEPTDDPSAMQLRPWDQRDYKRLGLEPTASASQQERPERTLSQHPIEQVGILQ